MSTRRALVPALSLFVTLSLFVFLAPAVAAETGSSEENVDLNSAAVEEIVGLPGVSKELAEEIVAHRTAEGPYESLEQVQNLKGMSARVWAGIKSRVRVLPPLRGEGGTTPATPTPGSPIAESQGITAIANYFVSFDGIDLQKLPPTIRKEFLDQMNSEQCPCGCVGDTIARCTVNDPACPVAPARLKEAYEESLRKAEAAEALPKP